MTMNAVPNCDKTETPLTRDEVKQMLRDAAFVLHMTRRVKAEMLAEQPQRARKPAAVRRPELSVVV